MPKAYWIARVDVSDAVTYKKYVETGKPAIERYNAKFLARGGRTEVLEGKARARNVLIEFASMDDALACYNSPEYSAARAIRQAEQRSGKARTPIVALTADALDGGKRVCQEAGMDGFLTKPVDPAELEEMFLMLFPSEERSHIVAA